MLSQGSSFGDAPLDSSVVKEMVARDSSLLGKKFKLDGVIVGGDMISKVSGELERDPFMAERELFMQNSIDAHARNISISVNASKGRINHSDDGDGMELKKLGATRNLGVSAKVYGEERQPDAVGFHKVGIFAGYWLAEKMIITTKPKNDPYVYTAIFHFGRIRQILREAKSQRTPINLDDIEFVKLVTENTDFTVNAAEPDEVPRSFTRVALEGIDTANPVAWDKLINAIETRKHLQTYNLEFEPFKYANDIGLFLSCNVPQCNSVRVKLDMNGNPSETIVRKPVTDENVVLVTRTLSHPGTNEPLAQVWILRKRNGRYRDEDLQGLIYMCGGIAVGKRNVGFEYASDPTQHDIKRRDYYYWLTGEVWLVTPKIKPNLPRTELTCDPENLACMDVLNEQIKSFMKDLIDDVSTDRKSMTSQTEAVTRMNRIKGRWQRITVIGNMTSNPNAALALRNQTDDEIKALNELLSDTGYAPVVEEANAILEEMKSERRGFSKRIAAGAARLSLADTVEQLGLTTHGDEATVYREVEQRLRHTYIKDDAEYARFLNLLHIDLLAAIHKPGSRRGCSTFRRPP